MALRDLLKDPGHYLRTRGSLTRDLVLRLGELANKRRPEHTWPELLEAINAFSGGFFRSTQKDGEIIEAMMAVEELRPGRVLEIGTYQGGTFFLLSRAARSDAIMISLDLPGGFGGGGYSAWKTAVFNRLIMPGQRAHFLRCDSHEDSSRKEVERLLGGAPLDVLFIDGDHSYEGVKRDFLLYSGLVRPEGLVLFHDIGENPPVASTEVSRFWREIKAEWDTRELLEKPGQGYGIGIIKMPAAPAGPLSGS